jgi:hypothetical protein
VYMVNMVNIVGEGGGVQETPTVLEFVLTKMYIYINDLHVFRGSEGQGATIPGDVHHVHHVHQRSPKRTQAPRPSRAKRLGAARAMERDGDGTRATRTASAEGRANRTRDAYRTNCTFWVLGMPPPGGTMPWSQSVSKLGFAERGILRVFNTEEKVTCL